MKNLYSIFFIWILSFFFCGLCIAEIPLNKDSISQKEKSQSKTTNLRARANILPKVTPVPTSTPSTGIGQNTKNETEVAKDDESEDEKKEESKIDKNDELLRKYKLIGIYLIGSQPRALIKNLEETEDTGKEYQQGDFLDDAQTFSVSKISFNPTARVELIDQDGINYLIKPHSVDVKNLSNSPKGNFAIKKAPTYSSTTSSSSSSKSKNRPSSSSDTASKSPDQPATTEQAVPPPTTSTPATTTETTTDKKDATSDLPKNVAPADASGSLQPQQQPSSGDSVQASTMSTGSEGAPQQATQQQATQQTQKIDSKNPSEQQNTRSPADSLDTSRPTNPFQ